MKIVYIAHPISGNVKKNIQKVLRICKREHSLSIFPFAPYIVPLQYLDDTNNHHRKIGMESNFEMLRRRYVDEVWVYGISRGILEEIKIAVEHGIPVYYKKRN